MTTTVEISQAGSQGPAGLQWRDDVNSGAWLTETDYGLRDGVQNNGSSFRCRLAHTSSASSEPGVGANWETYWKILALGAEVGGTVRVTSLAALLADNNVAIGYAGSGAAFIVAEGDFVQTIKEGISYRVEAADADAADYDVVNPGTVKLTVLPGGDGFKPLEAYGLAMDGETNDRAAIAKAFGRGGAISIGPGRIYYAGDNIAIPSHTHIRGTFPNTIFVNKAADATFPRLGYMHGTSDTDEDEMITDVTIDGIVFDPEGTGAGGFELRRTRRITIKNVWRFGPKPGKTAGSLISFENANNVDLHIENAKVWSYEGSGTRVLFGGRSWNVTCKDIHLYGGGAETIDCNGCYDMSIENVYGEHLEDEVVDLGNCSRITGRNIKGKNARLLNLKTEDTGFQPTGFVDPLGCHDNTFDDLYCEDYEGRGIDFGSGATGDQSFSNNKFSNFTLISAEAGATAGIRLASGDLATGSRGFTFQNGRIIARSGQAIAAVGNAISGILLQAIEADGDIDIAGDSGGNPETRQDHTLTDVLIRDGDFQERAVQRLCIDNLRIIRGAFDVIDAFDSDIGKVAIEDSPEKGASITFSNAANAEAFRANRTRENLALRDFRVTNTSLDGGSEYAFEMARTSAATIKGVLIDGLAVEDTQDVKTTNGVIFPTGIDYWKFINSHNENASGVSSSRSRGVQGANSINENNTGLFLSEERGEVTVTNTSGGTGNITTNILPISYKDIEVTPISDLHNVTQWWVTTPTFGNGFRILLDQPPGAGNSVTFRWIARRRVVA